MTDPKTPAQLADEAAEAIRALNHLTRAQQADWEYPGDAYTTVGNLAAMADRLPQLLEQIGRFVRELAEADHLRRDDGGSVGLALTELRTGLVSAERAAADLGEGLGMAHAALGPIAYQD